MPEASGAKAKRQGRGRPPRLSSKAIVAAAIKVADKEGLEAVSIRRIAAEVKARPMSLYDHIGSKDGLLALMEDEVIGEIVLNETATEDWREAVTAIAKGHHTTYLAHPWVLSLLMGQASFGPNARKVAKQVAETLSDLPLGEADVWSVFGTVNDFVLGYSIRAVSVPSSAGLAREIKPSAVAEIPALASLQQFLRSRSQAERFEFGLKVMLDGIEQQIVGGRGTQ